MKYCAVCKHPLKEQYERQIVAKELSQAKAAKEMGCSKATVSRHMSRCFPQKVAEWAKPEAVKEEVLNVVNALTSSRQTTLDILSDSLDEGDRRTALMALQTEIKQLDLFAKVTGQLKEGSSINILLSPEYLELKQIIYASLNDFPEARLKLSEALSQVNDDDDS